MSLAGAEGISCFAPRLRCPTTRYYRISLVDRGASLRSLLRPPDALATSPDTLRVPQVLFYIKKDTAKAMSLAGAEGIEVLRTPLAVPDDSILPYLACRPWRFVTLSFSSPGRARDLTRHSPSASGSFLHKKIKTPQKRCLWQGQKGSNPRHSVLETDALPAELYPYIILLTNTVDQHFRLD